MKRFTILVYAAFLTIAKAYSPQFEEQTTTALKALPQSEKNNVLSHLGVLQKIDGEQSLRAAVNNPAILSEAENLLAASKFLPGLQVVTLCTIATLTGFKDTKNFNPDKSVAAMVEALNISRNNNFSDADQSVVKKLIEMSKSDGSFDSAWSNQMSKELQSSIASKVSDPDTKKYGGPNTATVIKFITGQGQNNSIANTIAGQTAQLGQLTGLKYKEIKRGAPLKSLGPTIPVGTLLYPIRVVIDIQDMEQTTDYYFYKDEFGDWKSTLK